MDASLINRDYVTTLFQVAVEAKCADIHIKAGSPPKMRKNGELKVVPGYEGDVLSPASTEKISQYLLTAGEVGEWDNHKRLKKAFDFSYTSPNDQRFRMTLFHARNSTSLVARVVRSAPNSTASIGLPPVIGSLAMEKTGMVVVTGATGSGKSTTMAAMVHLINTSRYVHIVSLENPIEYIHDDALSSITQREINTDTSSFEDGLKEALRQDPDVIVIGEVRNAETMRTALRAAETGHLVVTTFHMTTAAETIDRMVALHTADEKNLARKMVASELKGIVCQRLLPSRNGGQIVVNEVLRMNDKVRDAILNEAPAHVFNEIIARSGDEGMMTFDQHIASRLSAGLITREVALDAADNKEFMQSVQLPVEDTGSLPKLTSDLRLPGLPRP